MLDFCNQEIKKECLGDIMVTCSNIPQNAYNPYAENQNKLGCLAVAAGKTHLRT